VIPVTIPPKKPKADWDRLPQVLSFLLLLAGCQRTPINELSGVVVDRSGTPVDSATVLLEGEGVREISNRRGDSYKIVSMPTLERPRTWRHTDSTGSFEFGSLPIGSYSLTIGCPSSQFRFGRVLARKKIKVRAPDRHPDLRTFRLDTSVCEDPSPVSVDSVFEGQYGLFGGGTHGVAMEFAVCGDLTEYLPDPDAYPTTRVAWTDFLADTLFDIGDPLQRWEEWRGPHYIKLEGTLEGPLALGPQQALVFGRPRADAISTWDPLPRYDFVLWVRRVIEFRPLQPEDCDWGS